MGYYTYYECLNSDVEKELIQAKIDEIRNAGEYDFCEELFAGEPTKWYDSDKDLKRLSEALPGIIIRIEGSGEDSGDLWVEVWLNGQSLHETWQRPDLDAMIAAIRAKSVSQTE